MYVCGVCECGKQKIILDKAYNRSIDGSYVDCMNRNARNVSNIWYIEMAGLKKKQKTD